MYIYKVFCLSVSHILFVPGGQTFLTHRRGWGQTFSHTGGRQTFLHRGEGGQTFLHTQGGEIFFTHRGGINIFYKQGGEAQTL